MWLPQWLDLKKNDHICKNLTQNSEPQRYSWERRRREEEEYWFLTYRLSERCAQTVFMAFVPGMWHFFHMYIENFVCCLEEISPVFSGFDVSIMFPALWIPMFGCCRCNYLQLLLFQICMMMLLPTVWMTPHLHLPWGYVKEKTPTTGGAATAQGQQRHQGRQQEQGTPAGRKGNHRTRSGCAVIVISTVADLPTCPYLPVLVWKSAGSTDVRPYFSKYGHSFQKVLKSRRKRMRVPCQQSRSWSVNGELSFIDICICQAISGAEVYGRSWLVKKVC